jgi:Uma2 family endonuclease
VEPILDKSMTTTIRLSPQTLTFDQFLVQLPDEEGRYELVNGEIMKILATRRHETIAEFIADLLKAEVLRSKLRYWVSGRIMVRTVTQGGKEQGRHPDVSVVDRELWDAQPNAYAAMRDPLQLAVEVVSTNWEDDYIDKLEEYQRLGISEYWIVDYLAQGSRNYLGHPKVPTLFVYLLDAQGIYQVKAYQGSDLIESRTFPELAIAAEQVLNA